MTAVGRLVKKGKETGKRRNNTQSNTKKRANTKYTKNTLSKININRIVKNTFRLIKK
jgi:hypothetical protein